MKVEIWSDVMCPFCYIGKRNYEEALHSFAGRNDIELVWKSFQLDPTIPQEPESRMAVSEYLAQRKGISPDAVAKMHEQVTAMAANAGLTYHLDKTVVANSFNAHRLIQFAKQKGLGDAAEEQLFYANFTEGKDFGDPAVLTEIGLKIGLTEAEVQEALTNDDYAYLVQQDLAEAQQIGISGVPFFVIDRKYGVSGAQPPQALLEVLEKAYGEEF